MNTTNPELRLAGEFVRDTGCHIFLTGKAGTGKTTFLRSLKNNSRKRLVVTAPTGVAAINAGGVSPCIRFSSFPSDRLCPEVKPTAPSIGSAMTKLASSRASTC
jgi:GTPase SAR1 family protein